MTVIRYTPAPEEWAHHFGPGPARIGIAPGDVVQVATEDCFGTAPVADVCNPNDTLVSKFPKSVLGPNTQAYGGVHARLAAVAEEYRSVHQRIR